jgi:hypothetical protein
MKRLRFVLPALLLAATALWNCGDSSPLAPAPAPAASADLLSDLFKVTNNLLVACPNTRTVSSTRTIGSAGGTITVGNHSLTIPRGALSRNVTITATAPAGNYNHVDFAPEGLRFSAPVTITMSYANCGLLTSLVPKRIVYTNNGLTSILQILPGLDDLLKRKVTGRTDHFSDYVMAW